MPRAIRFALALLLFASVSSLVIAQTNSAPAPPSAEHAQTAPAFDVNAAVEAYLAKMPPAQRARSNAYFEGGYWMQLWDFLATVFILWLLLHFHWTTGMRNLAARITRFRPLQTAIYWIQFLLVITLLNLPLTVYEGYFREHKYLLLNQTFGPWMRDQMVGLGVGAVLGAILIIPLFGLVRRLGKSWWVWGAGVMLVFLAFVITDFSRLHCAVIQ